MATSSVPEDGIPIVDLAAWLKCHYPDAAEYPSVYMLRARGQDGHYIVDRERNRRIVRPDQIPRVVKYFKLDRVMESAD